MCAQAAPAQTRSLSEEKRARISEAVSRFMAANSVPGIGAAVVLDGVPVWSSGYGMADLENFVPATSATLFRLASISKPITATAVLQLVERGKLDLDAPVQKYCAAFPQKEAPITTRELLGHLGGIRHYKPDPKEDLEGGNTKHFDSGIEAGLKFFENDPLVAQPGTHFHYSTQGYTLVGCAIEGASGEKYVAFLHDHVLVPSGMVRTQADDRYSV